MSDKENPSEGITSKVKNAIDTACLYPLGFTGFQVRKLGHFLNKSKLCRWTTDGISEGYSATRRGHAKRVLLTAYKMCDSADDVQGAIQGAKDYLLQMGMPQNELQEVSQDLKHQFEEVTDGPKARTA